MQQRLTTHCSFGAVIEEFEVQDAIGGVFAEKDNVFPTPRQIPFSAQQNISVH